MAKVLTLLVQPGDFEFHDLNLALSSMYNLPQAYLVFDRSFLSHTILRPINASDVDGPGHL